MWPWSRKKKSSEGETPRDPLVAYDAAIEDMERHAGAVRRSAATLLALKGELTRDLRRCAEEEAALETRTRLATARGDRSVLRTLESDRLDVRRVAIETEAALTSADEDAALLLETAGELARQLAELEAERRSAKARVSVGKVVSEALQARDQKVEQVLALDQARDEVERAHALAQIYREEGLLTKPRSGGG